MKLILKTLCSFLFALFFGLLANEILLLVNFKLFYPFLSFIIGFIVGLICYIFLSNRIINTLYQTAYVIEEKLNHYSLKEIIIGTLGVIIGLIIANLIGISLWQFKQLGAVITISLNIVLGYTGFRIATYKKNDVMNFLQEEEKSSSPNYGRPKILDTSVIIDGRILDLLQTGFIEGKVIIPSFVLQELRHIADSSDHLKRNRGRRGLDILNEIQKQFIAPVEIRDFKPEKHLEVDLKLLEMAQEIDAFVVTNDFNLNKVADFQGVKVLNINDLSNATKPVVLPGEDMEVTVIKDGKENKQGIAYLNDGTMIVVEGGKEFIGEHIKVLVTSVLQTSAGRMIFTKTKDTL